ncbi:pentapeptide repeat-containing protein [Spiroplasma citri]|uniref:Pentapeptide repeat-containing protein n=1 Tax=Spiroplasma citri TaxID=2133 RepID=A0AAX3SXE0_SPICI|nr:pentapeptide repeat-containing protein [Spiroplasma citri]WFG95986.1 pentapeptide repeat-containing protein [Spiroplasma citri]
MKVLDLRDANLRFAYLQDTDLSFANLRFAYLKDTSLSFANLQDADLQGANLKGIEITKQQLDQLTVIEEEK